MTLSTRGLGSKNLIPTAGLGSYGVIEKPKGGGGRFIPKITTVIHEDIRRRDYRLEEKEISPAQVLAMLDKKAVSEYVKVIKHEIGIKAPEARELLKARIIKQIAAYKIERVEQLNQETLAMILIAIAADE